jgi:anti-anti-sigma regulatory factor
VASARTLDIHSLSIGSTVAFRTAVLKIQRRIDRAAVVFTVSGRLDAENVSELCESLDAIPGGAAVVVDLTDLVLADRDVVRLLRTFEASGRIVLRNCPAYIRIWMAAEDIQ